MYEYVLSLFSKYSITLEFYNANEEALVKTLELATVEEIKAGSYWIANDNLVEMTLTRCGHVKKLILESDTSTDFHFNYQKIKPCTLDHLTIKHSNYVTRDHLLHLFMDCKEVIMNRAGLFKDEDLVEFLRKWMRGSRMEHFELEEQFWHKHGPTRDAVLGLPDAVEVLNAKI